MSVMVDGLAPRRPAQPQTIIRLPKPVVKSAPMVLPLARQVMDLRPPVGRQPVLAVPVPALPTQVQPIPARRPLSPLAWLVAGGASAAIVATAVLGLAHSSPLQFRSHTAASSRVLAAAKPTPPPAAAAAGSQVTSTQIQTLLNQFSAQVGAPVYMIVKDLKTGQGGSIASDHVVESASLYKLFVADGIYSQVDVGKLNLSDMVPGTNATVANCLTAMITVSDNICGESLEGILGNGNYNATLVRDGFTHTDWQQYPVVTSATDVALLLERLYNGTLLSSNASEQFLGLLKAQSINNRLPQGLPAGTTIAHKTGDIDAYLHDAGIVYGPKTDYLVVMMSGPWPDLAAGPGQFANLSSQLYKLFEQ